MFKKQKFVIHVETNYSKSVVSKVKNMLWDQFGINPKIENYSFGDDLSEDIAFYYVASESAHQLIMDRLKFYFGAVMEVK